MFKERADGKVYYVLRLIRILVKMTKKDKQPRDTNGKFVKKSIKLHDEHGNVAYFTKEEMAGFKNPDCEPATKGYVKCLIRKFYEIPINNYLPRSAIWILTALCFGAYSVISTSMFTVTLAIISAMFAINDVLMAFALNCDRNHNLKFVQKYTPPTCKKKDDCE